MPFKKFSNPNFESILVSLMFPIQHISSRLKVITHLSFIISRTQHRVWYLKTVGYHDDRHSFLTGQNCSNNYTQLQQQGTFIKTKIHTPCSIDYSILHFTTKYKLHLILYDHYFENGIGK